MISTNLAQGWQAFKLEKQQTYNADHVPGAALSTQHRFSHLIILQLREVFIICILQMK